MTTPETIVIELLQTALSGKLDPSSNFSPQVLAEAIVQRLKFNEPLKESKLRNINEALDTFSKMIDDIDLDMQNEFQQTSPQETLIRNFIRGQQTACQKLRESLKTLDDENNS